MGDLDDDPIEVDSPPHARDLDEILKFIESGDGASSAAPSNASANSSTLSASPSRKGRKKGPK